MMNHLIAEALLFYEDLSQLQKHALMHLGVSSLCYFFHACVFEAFSLLWFVSLRYGKP
jgi:hypothetical protein